MKKINKCWKCGNNQGVWRSLYPGSVCYCLICITPEQHREYLIETLPPRRLKVLKIIK